MLDVQLDDEFLIIGVFEDDDGVERRHASVFLRLTCGRDKRPVIIHLDSNLKYPQCSDRELYTAKETTQLVWRRQFDRYCKIFVYVMGKKYLYDNQEIKDRNEFAKEVIEGRPPRVPADASELHEEMSQRGKEGKKASMTAKHILSQRPNKSRRGDSKEEVKSEDEGTLEYQFANDRQGKSAVLNVLS
jgi:hypothetical protein